MKEYRESNEETGRVRDHKVQILKKKEKKKKEDYYKSLLFTIKWILQDIVSYKQTYYWYYNY